MKKTTVSRVSNIFGVAMGIDDSASVSAENGVSA
jgi:hypothetical protein